MISPLSPPAPPPPCAQAAARKVPASINEALLSHFLDKCVLPPTVAGTTGHSDSPYGRPPPCVRSLRLRSLGAAGNTGRTPRACESDPYAAREGISRLGTHARVRHSFRAPRRDDPRGAGAGRADQPGHPASVP